MLQKCYDLQNQIYDIFQFLQSDRKKHLFSQKEKKEQINNQITSYKPKLKHTYFSNINQIFSIIKQDLIKKDYLDYINKPNYTFLHNKNINELEIHNKNINELELYNLVSLDNCIKNDFMDEFIKKILEFEDIKFYILLKKIKENYLFLFHINYDFLSSSIQTKYTDQSYLYYNNLLEENNLVPEEIKFMINNILLEVNNYNNPNYINLVELYSQHKNFISHENNLKLDLKEYISKINSLKSLIKEVTIDVILKDTNNFFIKNLEKNYTELLQIIEMYKYENKIQDYLDKKAKLTHIINDFYKQILDQKKYISYYQDNINENEGELSKLKEYNYSIRELTNQTIVTQNIEKQNYNPLKNNITNKYYDEIIIKSVKIKNEIKEVNTKIDEIKSKQNAILHKRDNLVENKKNEKKNIVIRKRYQKVIDSYQSEIENLEQELNKLNQKLEDNNYLYKNKEPEIVIHKEENKELLELKKLLNKTKIDKYNEKISIEDTIKENNTYILEYTKLLKNLESKHKNEISKLNLLNNEYQKIFNQYNNYFKQKENLEKTKEIFIILEKIKNRFLLNRKVFMEYINSYLEDYINVNDINVNINDNVNDINVNINNKTKEESFSAKLQSSIILVLKLQEIITINKVFSQNNLDFKYDIYNLNLLSMIDEERSRNNKNSLSHINFNEYNDISYNILNNSINKMEIKDMSIDLKKMIYILQ
tara:strand:- start:163 stop:2286 length:2124 start_codon:yes stop_codon:yes gene_type:complete